MGSLEALHMYWTSAAALATLSAFSLVGLSIVVAFRRTRQTSRRLRLLRAAVLLTVSFWIFVAASLVLCFFLADPVEYGPATAKAVAILSIALALGTAGVVSWAIARGVPARVRDVPTGGWVADGHPLGALASRLGTDVGLPGVRVRVVEGPPAAVAEPPDTLVVSRGLLAVLTDEELEAVLLHELCHLTESDGPEKAFTGAVRRVLPFDPFVHLLDRASHREREFRADELAAKRMGGGAALASALVKLADAGMRTRSPRHPLLEDRVARLLA